MASPAEKDPNKKPSTTISRRARVGWVVAVFFIAAWMFGMGVMVGRETAPVRFDLDQLKKTLESLQRAPREPLKNAPPVESTQMKDKTKLDFYEVLPKNREDADVNLPKPTPPGRFRFRQGGAASSQDCRRHRHRPGRRSRPRFRLPRRRPRRKSPPRRPRRLPRPRRPRRRPARHSPSRYPP